MADRQMTFFLVYDKLIVQKGVPALISLQPDLALLAAADDDYGGVHAEYCAAQVFVTNIRVPLTSQEGTEAANEVGKGHPPIGSAVVLPNTKAGPPAPRAAELRPAHVDRAE